MGRFKTETVKVNSETDMSQRCDRCHKKVKDMTKFVLFRDCKFGPECIEAAEAAAKGNKKKGPSFAAELFEAFRLQKIADTVRGMKEKGLLQ